MLLARWASCVFVLRMVLLQARTNLEVAFIAPSQYNPTPVSSSSKSTRVCVSFDQETIAEYIINLSTVSGRVWQGHDMPPRLTKILAVTSRCSRDIVGLYLFRMPTQKEPVTPFRSPRAISAALLQALLSQKRYTWATRANQKRKKKPAAAFPIHKFQSSSLHCTHMRTGRETPGGGNDLDVAADYSRNCEK